MRKKGKFKRLVTSVAMFMCMFILLGQTLQVSAATAQESTSKKTVSIVMTNGGAIPGSYVGRYKFKYIGNTNYYQFFSTDGEKFDSALVENSGSSKAKKAAKAVLGKSITNSSAATLKKGGNGKIKAAYLVWQTRSSDGPNSAIALVDGSGKAKKISAKSAVVDNRRGTHSLYNMYTDVTSFVTDGKGKGKYGTYTVCNIPIWERELENNGESMASWELIVLEEGDNYPIRACSLTMTSTFSLNDNYDAIKVTTDLPLGGKLKTRADDGKSVTGQLFFGYSTSHNEAEITKTFTMENGTTSKGSISETDTAGKKVGGNSCVRMSLSNFSEKKFYDATSGAFSIKGKANTNDWGIKAYPYATFFLLGIAVDVAQPTFSGQQTTTVNTDGTVNVSAVGENIIKNTTTKQGDTGYYDGIFTVMLDNALEPVDTSNITLNYYNKDKNKTISATGIYNNHVVTFNLDKDKYDNYTNGSYLSYDIKCKVVDKNAAEYNNSHQLDGYLYSRGAKAGVLVEDLHHSSSSVKLEGYTVHYDGNGGDASNISDLTCKRDTYYQITTEEPQRDGYTFAKIWNTLPDGTGTNYTSGSSFVNLANINETKTLYAVWKPTAFKVTLHAGVGIDSVSGEGTYKIGQNVTISAQTKTGYHWLNWTGNPGEREERTETITEQTYTFRMPEHNVDLTANGEANTYTIRFDPNGGTGHIDDIVTTYDTDVTLPDGANAYKKYTLDGVNVTDDVVSGVIPEDLIIRSSGPEEDVEKAVVISEPGDDEETADKEKNKNAAEQDISEIEGDTEIIPEGEKDTSASEEESGNSVSGEEPDSETSGMSWDEEDSEDEGGELEAEEETKAAHPLKRAYPSVFLGWALYDDKDRIAPTWKAGDTVRNLTAENNGVVTLYAVWDDCPWITAQDLYYTLKQAQDGFITVDEILSHASAVDREDGSPILPGTNPAVNNPAVSTSFSIPDYQASEFTGMTHDAAISENLTVTDSVGNTYQKQIMVYVVDTTPRKVKPIGTTRFISEKYYNTDYEHGGLEDNSVWKTDPEYRAVLQSAFDNLRNDTPEQTYYFTHETILEMQQFIQDHGVGNSEEPGALQQFYNQFMAPNRIN